METTMFRMFNRLCLVTLCSIGLSAAASAQSNLTAKAGSAPATAPVVETDRSRDGLTGPVRRVRTEVAKQLNLAIGDFLETATPELFHVWRA